MDSALGIKDLVSADRLSSTLSGLVDIPSPTGEESPLSNHIAELLHSVGIEASTQSIDDRQSNASGILPGKAGGPNLLLYAPIDTVTSNNAEEDIPWAGEELRPDMQAKAHIVDGHIVGLGAHNPKGHAACIIEAARVLKELDTLQAGNIYFGFGAGGMPTHGREGFRHESGHGSGCAKLITTLPKMDGAIIAKSGEAVTWEEVGFIWMEVTVQGTHTYVGSRHLLPYRNAIADAGKLIVELEGWFERRATAHKTECVYPQAVVSHIEAGWKRMPAFTSACCKFLVDLRFGPNISAQAAEQEFQAALKGYANELNIEASARRTQTIEASRTPQDDPIIQTTISAWEKLKGRRHAPFTDMSGATDANILRRAGIPTARVGLPKANRPDLDFQLGMNCVSIEAMKELTTLLVMSAINFCGAKSNG